MHPEVNMIVINDKEYYKNILTWFYSEKFIKYKIFTNCRRSHNILFFNNILITVINSVGNTNFIAG